MTRFFLGVLILAVALQCPAAEQGQLDASPSVFSVLAAINAAGYDASLNSSGNHPIRGIVRDKLAAKNLSSVKELKEFFAAHRQDNWAAELSQYISFALSVQGPPDFRYRFKLEELPPDVSALEGFGDLMSRFYQEARLEELWQEAQPAFEEEIARYHEPVVRALLEVNGYLRNPTSGFLGRRFQIYLDLLAAPNQIHTRSYKDDYLIVVTPSAEPRTEEVRHAYLYYLLDPLVGRYSAELKEKDALQYYAQGASLLEEHYKSDFVLLTVASLVKAVEIRLASGKPEQKAAEAKQALREGYLLTPHFVEQLPAYEEQEQAMRFYFPEMVAAIDLKNEEQRLESTEFATERPEPTPVKAEVAKPTEPTGVFGMLAKAERLYADRELDEAKQAYLLVLQETDQRPLHAKAYYGLARIAALESNPELAEKLFERTLSTSPDPQVEGWAHVYLGRLADLAGERTSASSHYKAVLALSGASDAARKAAETGLNETFGNQNR